MAGTESIVLIWRVGERRRVAKWIHTTMDNTPHTLTHAPTYTLTQGQGHQHHAFVLGVLKKAAKGRPSAAQIFFHRLDLPTPFT